MVHATVEIALGEVGYMEKETPDLLFDKTANAGDKNFTKYARDLDDIIGFYMGAKQGCPWCDVFVDWCFVRAYGVSLARKLLCQPLLSRGAGCRHSLEYYEDAKRRFSEPEVGDQIFFRHDDHVCHTGIVVGVDEERVYTVEGNTSDEEGVIRNGGCVRKKSYLLSDPAIAGYGRPDYFLAETIQKR